jgi:hypothetical protein
MSVLHPRRSSAIICAINSAMMALLRRGVAPLLLASAVAAAAEGSTAQWQATSRPIDGAPAACPANPPAQPAAAGTPNLILVRRTTHARAGWLRTLRCSHLYSTVGSHSPPPNCPRCPRCPRCRCSLTTWTWPSAASRR